MGLSLLSGPDQDCSVWSAMKMHNSWQTSTALVLISLFRCNDVNPPMCQGRWGLDVERRPIFQSSNQVKDEKVFRSWALLILNGLPSLHTLLMIIVLELIQYPENDSQSISSFPLNLSKYFMREQLLLFGLHFIFCGIIFSAIRCDAGCIRSGNLKMNFINETGTVCSFVRKILFLFHRISCW